MSYSNAHLKHSNRSVACEECLEKLKTAHPTLSAWYIYLLEAFPGRNIHIAWAWRGKEDQEAFVLSGKSRDHYPNSPHNHLNPDTDAPESLALDLFQLTGDGKTFYPIALFSSINEWNRETGKQVKWGGTFRTIKDYDHFELIREV